MAERDLEDLGLGLPGLPMTGDLDWVSDAFTFLEYAEEEQLQQQRHEGSIMGIPASQAHGEIHIGSPINNGRTRALHAYHTEQGKHKRGRMADSYHPCQPINAEPNSHATFCGTAPMDCMGGGMAPGTADGSVISANTMTTSTSSLSGGSRPDALAQRMERKKTREKMRRMEVNDGFNELMEALTEVEPASEQASARVNSDKGNFRVELLSRAVRALRRLHQENKAERAEIERLRLKLEQAGISADGDSKPQLLSMMVAPPPVIPPLPETSQTTNPSTHHDDAHKPPMGPPVWVTVPMWSASGVKGDPNKPSPFPMVMPFCVPPSMNGMQHVPVPPNGFMNYHPVPPHPGAHPTLPSPMQGFPPVDQETDVPTHAPCA